MPAQMYYDQDADLSLLKGKTIAIIGYGSQGHAQAQNLRDSGCDVVVGQRPGSANYEIAVRDGFTPVSAADAAAAGDLINILLPDEVQGDIYTREIKPISTISISFPQVHWLKTRRKRGGATYFVAQSKRGWPISPWGLRKRYSVMAPFPSHSGSRACMRLTLSDRGCDRR